MLVYDITQEKTFDNISKWLRNIEEVRVQTEELVCCLGLLKLQLQNIKTPLLFAFSSYQVTLSLKWTQKSNPNPTPNTNPNP